MRSRRWPPSRFVPDDFEPTAIHIVRCQELKLDLTTVLERFRKQEFNREYSDWGKRFSVWIEDQKLRRESDSSPQHKPPRGTQPKPPSPGRPASEVIKEFGIR